MRWKTCFVSLLTTMIMSLDLLKCFLAVIKLCLVFWICTVSEKGFLIKVPKNYERQLFSIAFQCTPKWEKTIVLGQKKREKAIISKHVPSIFSPVNNLSVHFIFILCSQSNNQVMKCIIFFSPLPPPGLFKTVYPIFFFFKKKIIFGEFECRIRDGFKSLFSSFVMKFLECPPV